jgi:hypothetical protein
MKSMADSRSKSEFNPAIKEHIPRLMNAFMLYRKEMSRLEGLEGLSASTSSFALRREAGISKIIAQRWKKLNSEQQAPWYQRAKEEKERHMLEYPNYKYSPKRKHKGSTYVTGGESDAASGGRLTRRARVARGKLKGDDGDRYLPSV